MKIIVISQEVFNMSYINYYRVVISNDFLGVSKEISAPNRYELERKVEN